MFELPSFFQLCKYYSSKNYALQLSTNYRQQHSSYFAWSTYLPVYDTRSEKPPDLWRLFCFYHAYL